MSEKEKKSEEPSVFVEGFNGKLYYLEEKETFAGRIRFDYEKRIFRELMEGDTIFVENFNTDGENNYYTMLKIISLFPKHYALEAVKGVGYPAFLKDVMANIEIDWEYETSSETYVDCVSLPIGYDIKTSKDDKDLDDVLKKISKPIPGKSIKILSPENLQKIFTWGLNESESLVLGKYLSNESIEIWIDLSKMVRRHFGVFASTGGGKSNFIAKLVRLTSEQYLPRTKKDIKIVIFDIQGEYVALTSDVLYNAGLLIINEDESFPELDHYFLDPTNEESIEECSEIFSLQIKKPGKFEKNIKPFKKVFAKILEDRRIRKLSGEAFAIPQTIEEFLALITPGSGAGQWQTRIFTTFRRLIAEKGLSGYLNEARFEELSQIINELQEEPAFLKADGNLKANAETVLFDYNNIFRTMELMRSTPEEEEFSLNEFINTFLLGNGEHELNPKLIIISISDQLQMATIAANIVEQCIYSRRQNPNFDHDILFIFDEAHEYISTATQEQNEGVRRARRSLLKLARQGRKYGLGLCIATQRTRYLDTTIMGQIHTLFTGFLPRKTDREPLVDAFNIEEEVIREIKNFSPGQWLICSATATGLLHSVPISFKAEDSEEDLENFFINEGIMDPEEE